jgi:hypothetical protein
VDSLVGYLDTLTNSQIGIRLIGETEPRTLTVLRAHSDYVELSGLFGGEQSYAQGKMKKIRVPYTSIVWIE